MTYPDENRLADLEERAEIIREALNRPGGVTRPEPGYYVAYFPRAEVEQELGLITHEAAQIRARLKRSRPAAPSPEVRTSGPGRPAGPRHHRRKTLKLFTGLFAVVNLAVVVYVEKVIRHGLAPSHAHPRGVAPATLTSMIVVGLVFSLPALLILLVTWLRSRSAAVPAGPVRSSGYRYGGGL